MDELDDAAGDSTEATQKTNWENAPSVATTHAPKETVPSTLHLILRTNLADAALDEPQEKDFRDAWRGGAVGNGPDRHRFTGHRPLPLK
jgi:hypothetical protein